MYDMHIHTNCSHDCNQTMGIMCTSASERGLRGIAICNHADMGPCDVPGSYEDMCRCAVEVEQARRNYNIDILQGIEMAEQKYDPEKAKKILGICDYDVILGSVHYVECTGMTDAYSRVDFSEISDDRISDFFKLYFDRITDMIDNTDIDVLAHLTDISKAQNNPCHTPVELAQHRDVVAEIMKVLIAKGKGMEINTSGVDRCGDFLPSEDYLRLFKDLGGEIVTVGSDAHNAKRVGQYTHRACEILKDIFGYVCTFEDRKPIFHKL